MTVDLHHAETHLSELIAAAEAGEDVVIATAGRRSVKLVLTPDIPAPKQRELGRLKGKLNLPENWEEEWERMGEELTILMTESPFSTNE